jgi:hypothetical protein
MKEYISKEMAKKMKKRESFKSEPSWNHVTLEFDHEDKKKEKMVVTLFGRGKIIFSKMKKFHQWIARRDIKWVHHIGISSLLGM